MLDEVNVIGLCSELEPSFILFSGDNLRNSLRRGIEKEQRHLAMSHGGLQTLHGNRKVGVLGFF